MWELLTRGCSHIAPVAWWCRRGRGWGRVWGASWGAVGQRSHPTAPLPDKPTAKIEPHPQYPREGEKLQLQCDGQGNPV